MVSVTLLLITTGKRVLGYQWTEDIYDILQYMIVTNKPKFL